MTPTHTHTPLCTFRVKVLASNVDHRPPFPVDTPEHELFLPQFMVDIGDADGKHLRFPLQLLHKHCLGGAWGGRGGRGGERGGEWGEWESVGEGGDGGQMRSGR